MCQLRQQNETQTKVSPDKTEQGVVGEGAWQEWGQWQWLVRFDKLSNKYIAYNFNAYEMI